MNVTLISVLTYTQPMGLFKRDITIPKGTIIKSIITQDGYIKLNLNFDETGKEKWSKKIKLTKIMYYFEIYNSADIKIAGLKNFDSKNSDLHTNI